MKSLFRTFLTTAVQNECVWNLLKNTVVRISDYVVTRRSSDSDRLKSHTLETFFEKTWPGNLGGLNVLHGPFKGMKYPRSKSIGSSLVPKLIGSYEKELHPLIETICSNKYSQIIDVGCAEGYYAVGLAIRIEEATVFAYDLNQEAITLCREMALANLVSDRIVTDLFCGPETIQSFSFAEKTLIISDCEGYEKHLFTSAIVPFLAESDILIETHDFIEIDISTEIRKRFHQTHVINSIQSFDDIYKAHNYHYLELENYSLIQRKFLLSEERPSIMEWLFLTPRAK